MDARRRADAAAAVRAAEIAGANSSLSLGHRVFGAARDALERLHRRARRVRAPPRVPRHVLGVRPVRVPARDADRGRPSSVVGDEDPLLEEWRSIAGGDDDAGGLPGVIVAQVSQPARDADDVGSLGEYLEQATGASLTRATTREHAAYGRASADVAQARLSRLASGGADRSVNVRTIAVGDAASSGAGLSVKAFADDMAATLDAMLGCNRGWSPRRAGPGRGDEAESPSPASQVALHGLAHRRADEGAHEPRRERGRAVRALDRLPQRRHGRDRGRGRPAPHDELGLELARAARRASASSSTRCTTARSSPT